MSTQSKLSRRELLIAGVAGGAGAVLTLLGSGMSSGNAGSGENIAAASQLRRVLDRGKLIVGTGSTNPPWHFENAQGKLTGMDIAMAGILSKALFDDESKVEFVLQDSAARIPNIVTGKVDITLQFMTITAQRAQLAAFSRPYYIEGAALMSSKDSRYPGYDKLRAAGKEAKVSILQNADADRYVKMVLPDTQVSQIDTQANVLQALDSKRVDAAVIDLSSMGWILRQQPDRYLDAGKKWLSQLYGAAVRQGDPDWLQFVNTAFDVAMYGDTGTYDRAFKEFFGVELPARIPGFPQA